MSRFSIEYLINRNDKYEITYCDGIIINMSSILENPPIPIDFS